MQNSYLPIMMLQYISEYMSNPLIMKLLCKRTYSDIKIYKIHLEEKNMRNSVIIHHLDHLHTLSVDTVHNIDFSIFKCLTTLSISNCISVKLKDCGIISLTMHKCINVSSINDLELEYLDISHMNNLAINCDTVNVLKLRNCNDISLYLDIYKRRCIKYLTYVGYGELTVIDYIVVMYADITCLKFFTEKKLFTMLGDLNIYDLTIDKSFPAELIKQLSIDNLTYKCDCDKFDSKHYIRCYSPFRDTEFHTPLANGNARISDILKNIEDFYNNSSIAIHPRKNLEGVDQYNEEYHSYESSEE